jgi:hypothetical protein
LKKAVGCISIVEIFRTWKQVARNRDWWKIRKKDFPVKEMVMAVVTMKNLLESGVHFGHQVKRWDPRMKKYIFAERNGIHIIDLQKTIAAIKDSYEAVRKIVSSGKSVLFVGTKKAGSAGHPERS